MRKHIGTIISIILGMMANLIGYFSRISTFWQIILICIAGILTIIIAIREINKNEKEEILINRFHRDAHESEGKNSDVLINGNPMKVSRLNYRLFSRYTECERAFLEKKELIDISTIKYIPMTLQNNMPEGDDINITAQ
jgi:hypothetical protein